MKKEFVLVPLKNVDEMMQHLPIVKQLYPDMTATKYKQYLQEMIGLNYKQVAVIQGKKSVGLSGYWIGTRLWCGRYIDMDNVIVDPAYRSKGIGKLMTEWVLKEGKKNKCSVAVLDAYVNNYKAHKFYYREGFHVKGFHFVQHLVERK
jgi:ribosomal protein S18 acetylase RimI-like enzyme